MLFLLIPITTVSREFQGISTTFWNLSNRKLKVYWVPDDGTSPHPQSSLESGKESSLTSYIGHQFFWSEVNSNPPVPINEDATLTITREKYIYPFFDETTTAEQRQKYETRVNFMEEYYNRTGRRWLAHYPRDPPKLFLYPADYVGQKFSVPISEAARQHVCDYKKVECHSLIRNLTIDVIATKPRAFVVPDFLTDYESDWVVAQAKPKLRPSTTGNGEDASTNNVRTSSSWWLQRAGGTEMAEAIYRRMADVLRVPHELVWPERNSESINVLRYKETQEYTPHYDWWSQGRPEVRYVSILLYFVEPTKGGATSFPLAHNQDGTPVVRAAPRKNQCLFFYDILPDGNNDEDSLHAGEPVEGGEKWVGPLWLWEPNVAGGRSADDVLSRLKYNKEDGSFLGSAGPWTTLPRTQTAGAPQAKPILQDHSEL